MKKIFLSLLALCGMVAGFTLCSCGGGGGSTLSGTTLVIQTGQGYYISFDEKVQGTQQTYHARMFNDKGAEADLWVTVKDGPGYDENGKLNYMRASVSTTTTDYDDCKMFFFVVNTGYTGGADDIPEDAQLYAPAEMWIDPVTAGGGVIAKLVWKLKKAEIEDQNGENVITGFDDETIDSPDQEVVGSY